MRAAGRAGSRGRHCPAFTVVLALCTLTACGSPSSPATATTATTNAGVSVPSATRTPPQFSDPFSAASSSQADSATSLTAGAGVGTGNWPAAGAGRGQLLVVGAVLLDTPNDPVNETVSDNVGGSWTAFHGDLPIGGSDDKMYGWWKVASGGETRVTLSWENNDELVSADLQLVGFRGFTGAPHLDVFSQGADTPANVKFLKAPLAGPGSTAEQRELVVGLFGHTRSSGPVNWKGSTHVVDVTGTPGSGSSMVDIGWGVTSGTVDRVGEGITERWTTRNQAQTLTAAFSRSGQAAGG